MFVELLPVRIEQPALPAAPLNHVLPRGAQHADPVFDAWPHAGGRCVVEIPRRTGDFGDFVSEEDQLREHLVVEHEPVRVLLERKAYKHVARECAISRVILAQSPPKTDVLGSGQHPVGDELVHRHSAGQRAAAEHA